MTFILKNLSEYVNLTENDEPELFNAVLNLEPYAIRELALRVNQMAKLDDFDYFYDVTKPLITSFLKELYKLDPKLAWSVQCHELNDSDRNYFNYEKRK